MDGVLGPHGDIVARLVEMELSQGRDHVIVLQRKMLVHRVLVLPSILRAVWRALVQVIIKTILRVGTFERFALTWARKYYFVLHWQLLIRRIRIQRKRTGANISKDVSEVHQKHDYLPRSVSSGSNSPSF